MNPASRMSPWRKIGQRMAVGLPGTTLDAGFIHLVRRYKVGNVILFSRNLQNQSQAAALCHSIQALVTRETGHPALIAIDEEGGGVSRLPADMTAMPGAMALAATKNAAQAVEQAAFLTGRQLRGIGVNLNLAPVLDVNSNAQNPVIGARSFSDDPREVARLGLSAIKGYRKAGVLCCGKHFPGHGDTDLDSHLALPVVHKALPQLEDTELLPYRRLIPAGLPAVMTTHCLFPALEPDGLPATLSQRIVTGLLRQALGFNGLILSDDMEMAAVRDRYGTTEACVAALDAGVDIVYVCHSADIAEEALLAITHALEYGHLDPACFDSSVQRILSTKAALAALPSPSPPTTAEHQAQSKNLLRESICLLPGAGIPAMGARPFFAGWPHSRSSNAASPAGSAPNFAPWFAQAAGGRALTLPDKPTDCDITTLLEALAQYDATVLVIGSCNGHLSPRREVVLHTLCDKAPCPVVVVSLGAPYDLATLESTVCRIAAFEYSYRSLEALKEVLCGKLIPQGRLRVNLC